MTFILGLIIGIVIGAALLAWLITSREGGE
jgi:hypothetical protein